MSFDSSSDDDKPLKSIHGVEYNLYKSAPSEGILDAVIISVNEDGSVQEASLATVEEDPDMVRARRV